MDHKQTLIKLLGLPETADDTAIMNASVTFQSEMVAYKTQLDTEAETLRNSAAEAVTRAEEAESKLSNADSQVKALTEEIVGYDLERYKGVISNAEETKAQLISNRAGTIAVLKNIKAPAPAAAPAPLHNLNNGAHPSDVAASESTATQHAKKISNRAGELRKTLNISHREAWIRASDELGTAPAGATA